MKLKLKKSIFFANSSPKAIVHLVQRHCLLTCKIKQKITPDHSTKFRGNVLKLDLSE